jgi:DNA mismatch repair protein MutH
MPPDVEAILCRDWEELMELVALGRMDRLSARMGTWLQIRPKAMNAAVRTHAIDAEGRPVTTNPRGFYLRTACTREILRRHYALPSA